MNNERDPITEWEHAIGRRIGAGVMVCILAIVVGAMIAPVFGWWIKHHLYVYYAFETDCKERVEKTMVSVWIAIWIIAILAWIFVGICNSLTVY